MSQITAEQNETAGGRAGSPASAGVAIAGVLAGGSEMAEWPAPSRTMQQGIWRHAAAKGAAASPPTGAGSALARL